VDLKLKDKIALVTGGSRGLGKAICLALAAEGARVAVNYYRNAAKGVDLVGEADAVVDQIARDYGTEALAAPADVAVEADSLTMLRLIEQRMGPLDVLVNNAAALGSGPITQYTTEEWNYIFQVNVTGAFVLCREFVRRLRESNRTGRIVNIASQAAFLGSTSGHMPYDASKGAVVSLTRALAREVAPRGIGVNAVAPGMIRTEMVAQRLAADEDKYLARIPLHRIATCEEVAAVVVFLASDAASYMTGTTVDVTGGMMMR
jgi:3-oxoacyl-[acyl-carrier protein] reductase